METWKYRHFKWNEYEVIWIWIHTETQEEMVIYKALYWEQKIWVRPREMFEESIIIDGKKIQRFEYIC